jgi:UPF0755 protein
LQRLGRLVLGLCVLLAVARLGDALARQHFYAPGPLPHPADIVVPPGATKAVAAVLRRDDAITGGWAFRAAAWMTRHDGPVHAGEFLLPAHASLAEVLAVLRHAAPVQHHVTIPEGLTGAQIAVIINAAPDAAGHIAPPPQGAVLPQTYDYTLGTPRAAILARAEAALRATLAAAWSGRDPATPLAAPRDALILASIVQQESPLGAELPEIAAVYENRLNQGMRLQADPTVIFAASNGRASGGVPITRADLVSPSPYNTYLVTGLPPGPICAPGMAAIEAVLHPADSNAIYFVATGKGGHVFAATFKQQLQNIARYQGKEALLFVNKK